MTPAAGPSKTPFYFKTQLTLVLLTGLKARNLVELREQLAVVSESSVYYHTHHYLEQHQLLTPEPPNDFAYWVVQVLQEDRVGEALAAIDIVRFNTLAALRQAILAELDAFLAKKPLLRESPPGEEFQFLRSVLFSLPTREQASNLSEFRECLTRVSTSSLYYHVFSGRLRRPLGVNDFSDWLTVCLGESELARRIDQLDPYTYTMEGLRRRVIELVDERLKAPTADAPA